MPLSAVNFVPLGPVKSADILQFYNLLTGNMTDQPVVFANSLGVGGFQGVGTVPLRVAGVPVQTANMVELRVLAADAAPVFAVDKTGAIKIGAGGGSAPDLTFSRTGINLATLSGGLTIAQNGLTITAGNSAIGGAIVTDQQLRITGQIGPGATTQAIVGINTTFNNNVTVWGKTLDLTLQTAAAAYTMAFASVLEIESAILGAGSGITTLEGIRVENQGQAGITSAIGIDVVAQAGAATNNFGVRIQGGSPGLVVLAGGANITAGNLGIGTVSPRTDTALTFQSSITAGAGQDTIWMNNVFPSSATAVGRGLHIQHSTQATGFTMTEYDGIFIQNMNLGAGSTITNQYGIRVGPLTAGNTYNAGIFVDVPSGGTTNIGVDLAGGAPALRIQAGGFTVTAGTAKFDTANIQMTNLPAFAAGSKYLILDTSNFVRVSAIGPGS